MIGRENSPRPVCRPFRILRCIIFCIMYNMIWDRESIRGYFRINLLINCWISNEGNADDRFMDIAKFYGLLLWILRLFPSSIRLKVWMYVCENFNFALNLNDILGISYNFIPLQYIKLMYNSRQSECYVNNILNKNSVRINDIICTYLIM